MFQNIESDSIRESSNIKWRNCHYKRCHFNGGREFNIPVHVQEALVFVIIFFVLVSLGYSKNHLNDLTVSSIRSATVYMSDCQCRRQDLTLAINTTEYTHTQTYQPAGKTTITDWARLGETFADVPYGSSTTAVNVPLFFVLKVPQWNFLHDRIRNSLHYTSDCSPEGLASIGEDFIILA
ncbi:hypothetical protein LOTGIDRAFT_154027 [Lottia gigantea]|uniref:Uncharacterized protein n=1 Tax=Lottia gigantea TaxID=225164 RepID=V3ZCZ2_LOTGI|nr:hypothetical protein LOTGIDRAFT_154027 [Lottia gigantea]ESO88958.1 hypothetical protein LOTGIDRAFT_154027 [Lottia gigantea]